MKTKIKQINFKFNDKNILKAKLILKKYPKKFSSSALLPLLHLAQDQLDGWLNKPAIEYIAKYLNIPLINVYEVATFYHMFNLEKVGKYCIHVCTTTPCWLKGSDNILRQIEKSFKIKVGNTTKDNQITLKEIECLGACINAPLIKINNNFYENLSSKDVQNLINKIKEEKKIHLTKNNA